MLKKITLEVFVDYDLEKLDLEENDDFSEVIGNNIKEISEHIANGFEAGGSQGTIRKWTLTEENAEKV